MSVAVCLVVLEEVNDVLGLLFVEFLLVVGISAEVKKGS